MSLTDEQKKAIREFAEEIAARLRDKQREGDHHLTSEAVVYQIIRPALDERGVGAYI